MKHLLAVKISSGACVIEKKPGPRWITRRKDRRSYPMSGSPVDEERVYHKQRHLGVQHDRRGGVWEQCKQHCGQGQDWGKSENDNARKLIEHGRWAPLHKEIKGGKGQEVVTSSAGSSKG